MKELDIYDICNSIKRTRQMLDMKYCDRIITVNARKESSYKDADQDNAEYEHRGGLKALEGMWSLLAISLSIPADQFDIAEAWKSPSDDWYQIPFQYVVREANKNTCVEIDQAAYCNMSIGFQKEMRMANLVVCRWEAATHLAKKK